MNNILKYFKVVWLIDANTLLYFLTKLPIVGTYLDKSPYWRKPSKLALVVPGVLFRFAKMILAKNMLLWLSLASIPSLFERAGIRTSTGSGDRLNLFVFLFCLLPAIGGASLFGGDSEKIVFLDYFRVDPVLYYRTRITRSILLDTLFLFPFLVFLIPPPYLVVLAILIKWSTGLLGQLITLNIIQKKQRPPKKSTRYIAMALVLACYLLYVVFVTSPDISNVSLLIVGSFVLPIIIVLYGQVWNSHAFAVLAQIQRSGGQVGISVARSNTLRNGGGGYDQYTAEVNRLYYDNNSKRSPITYLHRTFCIRHSNDFQSITKQFIMTNLVLALVLGFLFRFGIIGKSLSDMQGYTPFLISWATLLSSGMFLTQRSFQQMDSVYLRVNLFGKEEIFQLFVMRLRKLLSLAILPASSLLFALVFINWFGEVFFSLDYLVKLWFLCVLFLICYELYHLLTYFLLQPYAVDMTAKSPFFALIKAVEWIFILMSLFVRQNVLDYWKFFASVIVLEFLLVLVVKKFGEKTFRIRI